MCNISTGLADYINPEFFRNKDLWEGSRVDGFTIDDLVYSLMEENQYVVTTIDGEVVAVTSYKQVAKGSAEVHTFVPKEFRLGAIKILQQHCDVLRDQAGFRYLYTVCSNKNKLVRNFLIKRLGFYQYDTTVSETHTIDGEVFTMYKLIKEL